MDSDLLVLVKSNLSHSCITYVTETGVVIMDFTKAFDKPLTRIFFTCYNFMILTVILSEFLTDINQRVCPVGRNVRQGTRHVRITPGHCSGAYLFPLIYINHFADYL